MPASSSLLTPPARALLAALLQWDRRRIADATAQYGRSRDFRPYRARQDEAEAALDLPPSTWSPSARELFRSLIESRWDGSRRGVCAQAARELGEDRWLQESQPSMFDP